MLCFNAPELHQILTAAFTLFAEENKDKGDDADTDEVQVARSITHIAPHSRALVTIVTSISSAGGSRRDTDGRAS